MSASEDGSGAEAAALRVNASRAGSALRPIAAGFHRVAGARPASNATFRGPARRSRNGAIDRCQLAAAISRSAGVMVTCASFSASANVDGETAGPETGPAPNGGGAPGVTGAAALDAGG